jgi:Ca2+/H+ antiporter
VSFDTLSTHARALQDDDIADTLAGLRVCVVCLNNTGSKVVEAVLRHAAAVVAPTALPADCGAGRRSPSPGQGTGIVLYYIISYHILCVCAHACVYLYVLEVHTHTHTHVCIYRRGAAACVFAAARGWQSKLAPSRIVAKRGSRRREFAKSLPKP